MKIMSIKDAFLKPQNPGTETVRGPQGPLCRRHGLQGRSRGLRLQRRVLPQPLLRVPCRSRLGLLPAAAEAEGGAAAGDRGHARAPQRPHPGPAPERQMSIHQIVDVLSAEGCPASPSTVAKVIREAGLARLPRRSAAVLADIVGPDVAPVARPSRLPHRGRRLPHPLRRAVRLRPDAGGPRSRPAARRGGHAGERHDPRARRLARAAGPQALGHRPARAGHGRGLRSRPGALRRPQRHAQALDAHRIQHAGRPARGFPR